LETWGVPIRQALGDVGRCIGDTPHLARHGYGQASVNPEGLFGYEFDWGMFRKSWKAFAIRTSSRVSKPEHYLIARMVPSER
jgi:hypothetical protein